MAQGWVSGEDSLAESCDGQSGEHVACPAKEAIEGWDVDAEEARRAVGARRGADDGQRRGGSGSRGGVGEGGELDGGDDDVGD